MKFAIMGSGGIGGYYGARLAQAGYDTHFIARGAHLEAMRADGLKVDSPLGDFHLSPVQVTSDPASIGEVDCILFTTKLWDLPSAADACRPLIGADTAVLSLHNGVSAEEDLAKIYGPGKVMGGVAEITSFIARPGVIAHGGDFARIRFGELDGAITPRAERLRDALEAAGIETELSRDINRLLWLKFILIAGTTSLTALTRQSIGAVRENPETRALLSKAYGEVCAVGRAKGVALDDDAPCERMDFTDTVPFGMTTSLAKDLDAGTRTELDWLAGYVSRAGAELSVPTPFCDLAYNLLKLSRDGRQSA